MKAFNLETALEGILEKDTRYDAEAYRFVCASLEVAVRIYRKPVQGPLRHLTARELLEGVQHHARDQFGPLSLTVLRTWGVRNTMDIGHIVFHLVEEGVLGKTDDDRLEDFQGVFDFDEAFAKPYRPRTAKAHPAASNP